VRLPEQVNVGADVSCRNDYFRTDHLKADLRARSVRSGTVTLFAQGTRLVLQMVSTIVLARLLTPQDFGLIAMVTTVTGLVAVFKDMGLSMATVQRTEINHHQVSTLFWVNVLFSMGIMLVTVLLAPLIVWFYDEPRLFWVTALFALGFLFSGIAVQHQALLRRQMRFGLLSIVEIVGTIIGVCAGVISAGCGAGYWALVIMPLVTAAVIAAGVWIACDWRPGSPHRRSGVREMLLFGGNLTAFNIVNYFGRNLDKALIGRVWGAGPCGLYSKAYGLLMVPLRQISAPLFAVALPGLSRLQEEPERFRSYYVKALSCMAFFTMPLGVLLFVLAGESVRLVFGPQWTDATAVFRYLALSVLVQPICNTSGWLYLSTGRAADLFKWGTVGVCGIVVSFFVGLPYGIQMVALAYACTIILWTVPCMYLAARNTPVKVMDIFRAVAHPFAAAVLAGVVTAGLNYFLAGGLLLVLRTLLCINVFGIAYLVILFFVFGQRQKYLPMLSLLKDSLVSWSIFRSSDVQAS